MKYAIMKYSTFNKDEFDRKKDFLERENVARVIYRTPADAMLNLGGTIWFVAKYNFITKRCFKYDLYTCVEEIYNSEETALTELRRKYESL